VRQGEIRFADLEPVRGSEANRRRPVVNHQQRRSEGAGDDSGTWRGDRRTSDVHCDTYAALPNDAATGATGLARSSKAQAEQVRSIDVRRLGPRIAQLPPAVIAELDKALRLHLSL
jgi:mRNA interferase MazF